MTTTMGVKMDPAIRQRLIEAADSIERTPHWIMKQAIVDWINRIEDGEGIMDLTGKDPSEFPPSIGNKSTL